MLEDEKNEKESITIIQALLEDSSIRESLANILKALADRMKKSPDYSWKHALAMYTAVAIVLIMTCILTWFGKIESEILTFTLGLIVGLLSHHIKSVFPLKH